jgi:hypothetical protein
VSGFGIGLPGFAGTDLPENEIRVGIAALSSEIRSCIGEWGGEVSITIGPNGRVTGITYLDGDPLEQSPPCFRDALNTLRFRATKSGGVVRQRFDNRRNPLDCSCIGERCTAPCESCTRFLADDLTIRNDTTFRLNCPIRAPRIEVSAFVRVVGYGSMRLCAEIEGQRECSAPKLPQVSGKDLLINLAFSPQASADSAKDVVVWLETADPKEWIIVVSASWIYVSRLKGPASKAPQ